MEMCWAMNSSTFPLLLETFPACDLFWKSEAGPSWQSPEELLGFALETIRTWWVSLCEENKGVGKEGKTCYMLNAYKPQGKQVKGVPQFQKCWHALLSLQTKSIFPVENRGLLPLLLCPHEGLSAPPWGTPGTGTAGHTWLSQSHLPHHAHPKPRLCISMPTSLFWEIPEVH